MSLCESVAKLGLATTYGLRTIYAGCKSTWRATNPGLHVNRYVHHISAGVIVDALGRSPLLPIQYLQKVVHWGGDHLLNTRWTECVVRSRE